MRQREDGGARPSGGRARRSWWRRRERGSASAVDDRYESDPGLPSQRAGGPSRRTRVDPLAEVWESEIVPMLAAHPRLRGTTILEELHRSHPGRFNDRVLRTLQRRLARWRA